MAQFRGGVRGQRGEATRLGSKNSGLSVFANGWHGGVKVTAGNQDGRDVFCVYATGGSLPTYPDRLIAIITEDGVNPPDVETFNREAKQ